jgi:hypothetical protein
MKGILGGSHRKKKTVIAFANVENFTQPTVIGIFKDSYHK